MIVFVRLTAALSFGVLTLAGPATAAGDAKTQRHRRPPATAPATASAGLRGALAADGRSRATAQQTKPAGPALSVAFAERAPTTTFGTETASSLTSLKAAPNGLTPLKSSSDLQPLCRAQCAKTRIICATTDADDCDPHWSQCVSDCGAASAR